MYEAVKLAKRRLQINGLQPEREDDGDDDAGSEGGGKGSSTEKGKSAGSEGGGKRSSKEKGKSKGRQSTWARGWRNNGKWKSDWDTWGGKSWTNRKWDNDSQWDNDSKKAEQGGGYDSCGGERASSAQTGQLSAQAPDVGSAWAFPPAQVQNSWYGVYPMAPLAAGSSFQYPMAPPGASSGLQYPMGYNMYPCPYEGMPAPAPAQPENLQKASSSYSYSSEDEPVNAERLVKLADMTEEQIELSLKKNNMNSLVSVARLHKWTGQKLLAMRYTKMMDIVAVQPEGETNFKTL
jgi:hypothetical protein